MKKHIDSILNPTGTIETFYKPTSLITCWLTAYNCLSGFDNLSARANPAGLTSDYSEATTFHSYNRLFPRIINLRLYELAGFELENFKKNLF